MKTPEQYEAIIDSLSRQLAAERLRADNGWTRYENANMGQKLAREELARLNAKAAEMTEPNYEAIARGAAIVLGKTLQEKFYWVKVNDYFAGDGTYKTRAEAFKAACEDNGLLGERLKPSISTKGSNDE